MSQPLDIAIVGLAGCYAGAPDVRAFWQNILDKVDAVTDAGPEWAGPYFEANTTANDRTYTTKGGFLRGLAEVNPMEFGVLPSIAEGGDPDHLMALKYARDALLDAGYLGGQRAFDPERAGVVIGRGTYGNRAMAGVLSRGLFLDQAMDLARALRPDLSTAELAELRQHFRSQLPPYNADMVGPTTPNVIAGLIANRLNLMGPNYIVDAACASSLFALDGAVRELVTGRCDLMLAGGVQSHTPPQLYIQFSQIQALSHGQIRPFQKGANGILLGEGVGMLVLKRLGDAERDGDRVYAVIKGIGLASDGRAKGLLAPRLEGQVLALRHAYDGSGVDPRTVDLIEAHGTGTEIGDRTEVELLNSIFGARGPGPQIAVGSVKSMIGHCLPAAGSASLIKTALALHHKVLPPTLCDEPNPELLDPGKPLYINNQTRPWIHGRAHPRRAGVNAFGFGGANAHVILEEYAGPRRTQLAVLHAPPSELITLAAESTAALAQLAGLVLAKLRSLASGGLAAVAKAGSAHARGEHRLAIVAEGAKDLANKLAQAIEMLTGDDAKPFRTRSGIYYAAAAAPGKVCFLFPGEGAQYTNMLADLCLHFPQVREWFDLMDRTALDQKLKPRSPMLFPVPSGLDEIQREILAAKLHDGDAGTECASVASLAMLDLLDGVGLKADGMLGYGAGEFTVIAACGLRQFGKRSEAIDLVRELAGVIRNSGSADELQGESLLTADALWPETRERLFARLADVNTQMVLVADNCPNQVVVAGPPEEVAALKEWLRGEGAICIDGPAHQVVHTPLGRPLADAYRSYFRHHELGPAQTQLYSVCSAAPFPDAPEAAGDLLASQWEHPVRFAETIDRLYVDGYRIFIEVGPSGTLTSFVRDILQGKPDVTVVASDDQMGSGMHQFHQMLAQVFVAGVPCQLDGLYTHRDVPVLDLYASPIPVAKAGIKLKLQMPQLRVPSTWKPIHRLT